jgi:hypothetical protein
MKYLMIGFALALASCRLPGRDADKGGPSGTDAPPPKETGHCENEHVEGVCRLDSVQPLGKEQASGPEGTVLCRINHEIVDGERSFVVTSGYLRVPEEKVDDLSGFFRSHDNLPCKAYIVRPPCNPDGTSVTMDLAPPDYAKPERF